MKLTLIRHTHVDVPKGICYGRTDVPLATTFEEEANVVKQQLTSFKFDKVFTSPLTRATRLAEYCGYPYAVRDERLLELDFGDWEMHSYDELYQTDEYFKRWCEHYWEMSTPHGESLAHQAQRFADFRKDLTTLHTTSVNPHYAAFCHGGILTIALAQQTDIPIHEAFSRVPPYGSVITIDL